MNVTREVILDLLPVYVSGEASPETRALVEEFLQQDRELAAKVRGAWMERMAAVPSDLPPELELRAFRRTKHLLGRLRWLLGGAIFFTSIAFSLSFETGGLHPARVRFFLLDQSPIQWAVCLALGCACWTGYVMLRRRLRSVV